MTIYTNINEWTGKSSTVDIDDSEHTTTSRYGIPGDRIHTTPYRLVSTTKNDGVYRHDTYIYGIGERYLINGHYRMFGAYPSSSSAVATCKSIAQLKVQALNGINPEKNSYGLDIAEAAQIPRLLPDLGLSVMKMIQHLKSKNGSGLLHATVNLDLLVKFGFIPTLQAISEWLNAAKPRGLNGKVVTGFASDTGSASAVRKVTNSSYANGTGYVHEVLDRKVKYKYRLSNPTIAMLNSNGLLNVPGIIYQMVPLSFMLDWVSNVGQAIKTLGSSAGYTYLDGYGISVRNRSWYFDGRNDETIQTIVQPAGRSVVFERIVVTDSFDASSFYFDLSNTSVGKAVTAAEVLLQRIGRR